MKEYLKKNVNYFIVFFVPWIMVVVHVLVRNIWFTGQGSLLSGDTGLQLYPLMVEFWDKVHSGESVFYSWNAGNGFDFYLNMIDFLMSPFNLIILLLPKACIEIAIQLVMVLKWSFMGLSITYYFMHTRYNTLQVHKRLISSVLGIAFVFSNAIIAILGSFNLGDVIILFPFILLSLERLMEAGDWKQYYLLLTLAMLCNFYMAYQVCIFLVLWFFIHLDKTIDKKLNRFFTYVGSSILAFISSFVVIIPAVMGAVNRNNGSHSNGWINNIYSVCEKLFLFSDGVMDSNKPNIYFSIGFFVCLILFFFINMDKFQKGKICIVWLFLFVSLFSGAITVFWQGFSATNGVDYRYLYILIFLMLYMVMKTIIHLQTIKKWKLLLASVFEIGLMVVCFLHITGLNDFYGYLITFMLLILYNLLLYFYLKGSIQYNNIIVAITVLVILELSANAFYELKEYDNKKWGTVLYNDEAEKLSKDVELKDGERVSFSDSPFNFALTVNLSGTNQFISYNFDKMVDLYNKLGMEFDSSGCVASGTSPLLNLIFNIRYGISSWEGDFSDTELIKESNKLNLYRINRLAGLGYMVDEDIVNWNTDDLVNFDLQNDFVQKALGGDAIFTSVMPEEKFADYVFSYNCDEEKYKKGYYYYYDYVSKNVADTEMTEFSFTVSENMDLYMDAFSQQPMTNIIYINDQEVCRDRTKRNQSYYHIGNVKKGQKVIIYSLHSMDVGEEATLWFRFARFNEENYAKAYEKLLKNVYNIETMASSYVSGNIHADKDGIMMTSIPAMDGFTVYVDGEKTGFEKIGDALIGVPLTAGDHKVEFKYMTPYFKQGLICSLIGVMIFITICIFDSRKKKRSANAKEAEKVIEG